MTGPPRGLRITGDRLMVRVDRTGRGVSRELLPKKPRLPSSSRYALWSFVSPGGAVTTKGERAASTCTLPRRPASTITAAASSVARRLSPTLRASRGPAGRQSGVSGPRTSMRPRPGLISVIIAPTSRVCAPTGTAALSIATTSQAVTLVIHTSRGEGRRLSSTSRGRPRDRRRRRC